MAPAPFFISKLRKKDPEAYRYFKKAIGYKGGAVVRCKVAKHSACRGGSCAAKKTVTCHSVCPIRWLPRLLWTFPGKTPDCHGGRRFCDGTFKTKDGKTQSYGAFACQQIAMMA